MPQQRHFAGEYTLSLFSLCSAVCSLYHSNPNDSRPISSRCDASLHPNHRLPITFVHTSSAHSPSDSLARHPDSFRRAKAHLLFWIPDTYQIIHATNRPSYFCWTLLINGLNVIHTILSVSVLLLMDWSHTRNHSTTSGELAAHSHIEMGRERKKLCDDAHKNGPHEKLELRSSRRVHWNWNKNHFNEWNGKNAVAHAVEKYFAAYLHGCKMNVNISTKWNCEGTKWFQCTAATHYTKAPIL